MAALHLFLALFGSEPFAAESTVNQPQLVLIPFQNDTFVVQRDLFAWDSLAALILAPTVDSGYAFASTSIESSMVCGDTLLLIPEIDSGPLVRISGLTFAGSVRTRPGLLAHLAGFSPFRYTSTRVDILIGQLEEQDCPVLDWEILKIRGNSTDTLTAEEPVTLNLLVDEVRIPNHFLAAVGYSDAESFIGSVNLAISNPFGGRRQVKFSWSRLASRNVSYDLSFRDPYIFHLPFGFGVGGLFRSYDSTSYQLEASGEVFFNPKEFEIGLGYAYLSTRVDSLLIRKNLASTRLRAGPLEVGLKAGERKEEKSRAYLDARAKLTLEIPLPWLFSFYIEPNGALVVSGDSLVTTELAAVGGTNTLRGYLEEEFRSGQVLWSRQELRWGSDAFSLYPLIDFGWMGDVGFRAGYGAGIEIATPIGQFRLDAALPWGQTWDQGKLHLSLSADF